MPNKALLSILLSLVFHVLWAGNPSYLTVSPKTGDGVLSLLSRYHLDQNSCDIQAFYELNNLEKGDGLFTHRMYKLPIYVHTYNSVSIRSTIGDNDWDKAVRIQIFNEKLHQSGIKPGNYRADKVLWVPYSEIQCDNTEQTKIVESKSSNVLKVPYFGEDYQRVEIQDYTLKDKVYYIVAGHGGPDPGAMSKVGNQSLCEDEYAYDVSLRLARNLMQHGATVHVIIQDEYDGIRDEQLLDCDHDEKLLGKETLPLNQKRRLNQRAAAINRLYREHKKRGVKEQLAIFIHIDSNNASMKQDVYFYHHKNSKGGKKVAKNILKTFDKKYKKHQKGRGYEGHVSSRGLYVLNYTQPVSVFIELGNLRNKADHRRFLPNYNRQALANWIFEGVR